MKPRGLALALVAAAAAAAAALDTGAPIDRAAVTDLSAPLLRVLGAPTATSTPRAEPRIQPTVVVAPGPERTLLPGAVRQLLTGGCCAGAWWADDSSGLRFLDRPDDAAGASLYGVALWPPGSHPTALSHDLLEATLRDPVVVRQVRDYALVEERASGDRWPLPTDGNPVLVSPDGMWAAWWDAPAERVANDTLVTVWASDIYGFDVREICRLWGAQVVGFGPDSRQVIVLGRDRRGAAERVLVVHDVQTAARSELARATRLADAVLSPDRTWVSYSVSLDTTDPGVNGIWARELGAGPARKLPFEGAYRWRWGHSVVYVPLDPASGTQSLWELDVRTLEARQLIGSDAGWLRIANNDWSVSPDGNTMAFVNQADRNVWVVDLAP